MGYIGIDAKNDIRLNATSDLDLTSDSTTIKFGADDDVTITHDPDDGLIFKSIATADDNPFLLTIQTGETDLAANDVIGKIEFQAPDESTGTDAILVSAAIQAVAEGDFSSSSNATRLEFMTGASEAASERMRIDSSGQVMIGTTDEGYPDYADTLTVANNASTSDRAGITIRAGTAGQSAIYFSDATGTAAGTYQSSMFHDHSGGYLSIFTQDFIKMSTGSNERMRIDSSGHVFVAKSSSALATVGSELLNDGRIVGTADGQDVLLLNRKSSHGDIIDFYKDGSIVGNIGSASVGGLEVTGNNSSKSLILTTNFFPGDGAGAKNDNSIDLGISDARWKDLYLGGGVYVGGTGSANYLDDYEEGTWTAQLTDGTNDVDLTTSAVYTKIGNLVTVSFDKYNVSISSLNTSDLSIKTLPFPSNANSHGNKIIHVTGTSSGANTPVLVYPVNTATALALYKAVSSSQNMAQLTKSDLGSSISIRLTLTYFTNS